MEMYIYLKAKHERQSENFKISLVKTRSEGLMSKFNTKPTPISTAVKSHEGGVVFQATGYQELCDRVLTSFFGEDKFYETAKASDNKLKNLIHSVAKHDPLFVAKLAVLAREEFKLRSVSQVLVAELSQIYRGDSRLKAAIARVVQRPDDMTEILSYIISSAKTEKLPNGRTRKINKAIPNSIKKGLAEAFIKFDAYQLSKYGSTKKEVSLKDIIRLVHPTPKSPEQSEVFKKVLEGTLEKAETWERAISASGASENKEEAKTEAWESLIMNQKLGYMATLRNINNFLSAKVSREAHKKACDFIANEKAVLGSKQMPFRFYSAYKILEENARGNDPFIIKSYQAALATAMKHSVKNMQQIPGRTMVVADTSGSMNSKLSDKSTMTHAEIATLMCAIVNEMSSDSVVAAFSTTFKIVNLNTDNILENAQKVAKTDVGYGTNTHLVFDYLNQGQVKVDNIIIISDMQVSQSIGKSLDLYKKMVNPDVTLYEWNVNSYGTNMTSTEPNHVKLAGWHDNMIKFVSEYKTLKNGIIDMVNKVEL